MHCTRSLIVLLAVSLSVSACSMSPANQEIVLVSIHGPDYESAADCLAEIDVVYEFYHGDAVWLELTPFSFEKLRACGMAFERWHRVVVSLSKTNYERLADIEALHVTRYGNVVWLELTPSSFDKVQATGVTFELRDRATKMRLGGYSFDPVVEEPSLPAALRANYRSGKPAFYLVQLYGPSKDAWLAELEAKGAENLGYYTAEAYRMRMTPRQAARTERFEFVRSVVPYHPAFRISPYLFEC
jgi:hypothetical protein